MDSGWHSHETLIFHVPNVLTDHVMLSQWVNAIVMISIKSAAIFFVYFLRWMIANIDWSMRDWVMSWSYLHSICRLLSFPSWRWYPIPWLVTKPAMWHEYAMANHCCRHERNWSSITMAWQRGCSELLCKKNQWNSVRIVVTSDVIHDITFSKGIRDNRRITSLNPIT